ncbi:WD40 repeat domain-containing protein [Tuwongella immobilis]|uniref:Wd-40 repeat protein n=1 Tax=Tuwongella immobilis TaxID=692036 RepID=A0A6C2YJM7_9BACT|nr:hypothetical protein [Tuwongella immobilis]VIP01315.1 wd-40 repeat protein : [Tuwongella immobilis]VTR98056.1 wd-40 repeat protein : [Tuwongella immobilis]
MSHHAENNPEYELEWNTTGNPEGNLIFTSNNRLICPVGPELYQIDLLDPPTKQRIYSHPHRIDHVAVSPNGRRMVISSGDELTELEWNHKNWKVTANSQLPFIVSAIAIDDAGGLIAGIHSENRTLWRRSKAGERFTPFFSLTTANRLTIDNNYVFGVTDTRIDPVSQRIAIAYNGGVCWVSENGANQSNTPIPGSGADAILMLADKKRWVFARFGEIQLFSGDQLERTIKLQNGVIRALAEIPGRNRIVILANRGNVLPSTINIIDLNSNDPPLSLSLSTESGGRWVCVSPNGSRIAAMTGFRNKTILKIWRTPENSSN